MPHDPTDGCGRGRRPPRNDPAAGTDVARRRSSVSAPTWQYLIGAAGVLVSFAALSAVTNHSMSLGQIAVVLVFGTLGLLLGQWLTGRMGGAEE